MGILTWFVDHVYFQMIVFTVALLSCLPALYRETPWMLFTFVLVGFIPLIESWIFQKINLKSMVSKEKREEENGTFPYNIYLLSYFNIYLTSQQGMMHVSLGHYLNRIDYNIWPDNSLELYTWIRVAWQVCFMLFIADFTNYFYHKWSHENRWIYKHMHKLHHTSKIVFDPILSLFFVNPTDMIISNICFMSGLFIFKTDLFTISIYAFLSSLIVGMGHSGIIIENKFLDWLFDPSFHFLHHRAVNYHYNYSEHMTICDRIFGTYLCLSKEEKEKQF